MQVTLDLPDELFARASDNGLFAPSVFASMIASQLKTKINAKSTATIDKHLIGSVAPEIYRKGEILGDIVGSFNNEWNYTE